MALYAAYLRKSRADREAELRGEGETLARHRKLLIDLAARMDIQITRFYSEIVSGETIADRPVMRRLLKDVKDGMWAGILVVEIERLARGNTRDQGIVADAFKYSGTRILTPVKVYDPNDEFDEEYFEFGLYMSRREYKTINRRLQRGRIASLKEGNFIGSAAPYGYRRVRREGQKGFSLEIIEAEAAAVRLIYQWYCFGALQQDGTARKLGPESIARRLDRLGILSPAGGSWSKSTVSDILQNPTYAGYLRFGYRKTMRAFANEEILKTRKREPDCLEVRGNHPPIIEPALYRLAGQLREEHARPQKTAPAAGLKNPLAGLVYCRLCGCRMTRLAPGVKTPYPVLRCPNRYCGNISCPLSTVEEQILQFLRKQMEQSPAPRQMPPDSQQSPAEPAESEITLRENALHDGSARLAQWNAQLDAACTLLEQGVYTPAFFEERKRLLDDRIRRQQETCSRLKEELEDLRSMLSGAAMDTERKAPAANLYEYYLAGTAPIRNLILIDLLEKVTYEKTERNKKGSRSEPNFSLEIYPRIRSL